MSLHFPLPKIRTFRFSIHISRLSLRGEVTMVALKFAMSSHFPLPKIFSPSRFVPPLSNGTSRATSDRKPKTNDQILPSPIKGSAEALPILCVRYIRWERERERERERYRERRKWRHHCRAKIGDEFTCSLCQKFAQLAMSLHFPLPKTRTFRFSLHTSCLSLHCEVTIVALKFAIGSHFPLPKFFSPSLFPLFQNGASRATSDRKPKTNDQILPSPILFFPSKKWIKLIPKTIGNRKRDCAWGGSGW